MSIENNSLNDFSWDDNPDMQSVMEGVLVGEETNDVEPMEQEEDDEEDDDFGKEEIDNDEEKVSKKKSRVKDEDLEEVNFGQNKTKEPSIYDDVYKDLKQYGILKHVNLEEGESVDADRLQELYEQDYEQEVNNRIGEWANNELDEDAQAFIKFKRAGGKTEDFLEMVERHATLPDGDINDEDFQDEIIRYSLAQEGDYSHDDIEDTLEELTNNGKKKQRAMRYYQKIEQQKRKEQDMLIYQQEQARKEAIYRDQAFRENIKESLSSTKEINGIKISDKEKGSLYDFMTKANIQVNDKQNITGFQKKLAEVFQDTNKMILLAKLLSNDLNMKDFKKQVETETTRKVKSNLENRKGLNSSSFGSSTKGINLSEIFGN